MDTKTVPYQPGVLLLGGKLSEGVPKIIFFFFYPFFKPLKFSFNFMCTPA